MLGVNERAVNSFTSGLINVTNGCSGAVFSINLRFDVVALDLGEIINQMTFADYSSLTGLVEAEFLVVKQEPYTRRTNPDDCCGFLDSKFLLGNFG